MIVMITSINPPPQAYASRLSHLVHVLHGDLATVKEFYDDKEVRREAWGFGIKPGEQCWVGYMDMRLFLCKMGVATMTRKCGGRRWGSGSNQLGCVCMYICILL